MFEWAWSSGRNSFPKELFQGEQNKDCFVKYLYCDFIKSKKFQFEMIDEKFKAEISALSQIKPHALITTNYDLLLEDIFQGYVPISGQTILRYNTNSIGEIFHIHGDIKNPESIVFTQNDYDAWKNKKKYLAAKLLTYFAEHPVFIIGYGLNDPNVKEILMDIGELLADGNGVIDNVYQIIWSNKPNEYIPLDYVSISQDTREYKIKAIYLSEFEWLFNSLKSRTSLEAVNVKLIRAFAARVMKLVREDIPKEKVSVNYDVLEKISINDNELPTLLGISTVENVNQSHPLSFTQLRKKLGLQNDYQLHRLIKQIQIEKDVNIRASDNIYHCNFRIGEKSSSRKWSFAFVEILKKVQNNEPYNLEL
ncbi:SIR2 family NAD-dependent protein deacylase [Bartonella sp. HY761]|uniref:SIR2 family NAD-dependent protein deacylase n=1 Tax=Bartonella sp. HY761 TaxID=2979330 RepID=UPI00220043BF|nr:SIR2 family protein [Bartonella sp. HY761]UXN06062.1 SIR2 family protein [Bartonella sp. HY761]